MESSNPADASPANINPVGNNPVPSKRRVVAIIILSVAAVLVGMLFAVNYLSSWKCVGGEWMKDGFPLGGKPKGGCALNQEMKPASDYNSNVSEVNLDTESAKFDEPEISGLEVTSLKKGDTIKSPLVIEGRARGTWYFEASFPIKILDGKGNVFAETYANAQGEWMTEDWVPFKAEVAFSSPVTFEGFVLFAKDNPSGMPQNDYSVAIPIKFSSADPAGAQKSISEKCGHDPMNDPILGDCGEDCNPSNLKVYTNKKYGYSFKYSPEFVLSSSCKHSNCLMEEEGGDSVVLTGDLSEKGWPLIEIRHLGTEAYNPPSQADIPGWIQDKFSWTKECFPGTANIYFTGKDGHLFGGWNMYFPRSPQAYSRREIYYEYKGDIFQILMLDADEPQARQFYNSWLSTFSVIGES